MGIREGFAAARWPGRLQQLEWQGIPLLLDGAHNPPAAAALRKELDAQPGRHGLAPGARQWVQAANGAVALGMLRVLGERGWRIPTAAIREGFAAARWPGRLQQLEWQGIPLLLDGAHNPPAAAALREELDAQPSRHGLAPGARQWVLGILGNKQGPELVETLLGPADRAWIVPVPGHGSWSRCRLAEAIPPLAAQLQEAADLDQGLRLASQAAPGQRLIVAGSLYLIGDLLARSHALSDAAPE